MLVGAFFIFNGTSDSYQPNLSTVELESRQTSVEIGTSLIVSAYAIQAPFVEVLSNTYDCANGFCDPSLLIPGSSASYATAAEELVDDADDLAYRYVDDVEASIIERNGGVIPNVDRRGFPKNVSTSPNRYETIEEAENALLLGRRNPGGPTNPPTHRATYKRNSVAYIYAGNSQTGTGIEMITSQEVKILRLERLLK